MPVLFFVSFRFLVPDMSLKTVREATKSPDLRSWLTGIN